MFQRGLFSYVFSVMGLAIIALSMGTGLLADSFLMDYKTGLVRKELELAAAQASVQAHGAGPGLQKLVQTMGHATGLRFTVVARDGRVLADSTADPARMENHANRPEIAAALQGRPGVDMRKSATLGMDELYATVPTDPVFRAARPMSDVEELTGGMRMRLLIATAIAIMAALVLSRWVAMPLVGRINEMKRFTTALAAGDYSIPFESTGPGELGDLERSLEALRVKLLSMVQIISEDKKKLPAIIDGLPDATLLFSASGRLTAANKAAIGILRLPEPGWDSMKKEEVVREPEILKALDAAMSPGAAPQEPVRLAWRDPEMSLEALCLPAKDHHGARGAMLLIRDVTRQNRLERVRADFIANMAHELLTPLTAIRGAAETVMDSGDIQDGQSKKFIASILHHSTRLGNILADVSALSMIESGATPPHAAPIDARRPAAEAVALFALEAEKAGLTLRLAQPEAPLNIVSDPEKIESILVNLAQNSIRYTPSGGSVTVTVKAAAGGVEYEVADTGVGIPYKDLPRVTERFYRVDPARSREKGGTGLGLSIVKRLALALGGKLSIESQLGKGTTVRVNLPSLPEGNI